MSFYTIPFLALKSFLHRVAERPRVPSHMVSRHQSQRQTRTPPLSIIAVFLINFHHIIPTVELRSMRVNGMSSIPHFLHKHYSPIHIGRVILRHPAVSKRYASSITMMKQEHMHATRGEGHDLLLRLGNPRWIAAPMVQQSDLAFRTLVRRYGIDLAYTQMFHATNFANVKVYREENWDGLGNAPENAFDRPLIAQFAGDSADELVRAASLIQHEVDAVDLNLGCPQRIAKRGHYGAYLLEERNLVVRLLSHMVKHLAVPVTTKIRLLPNERDTLELVKAIEDAGVALLTIHGRTREQNKMSVGKADWAAINKIKCACHIPVVANGGVETYEDALACQSVTGADAVMSSEGLLENPSLFLPGSSLLVGGERSRMQSCEREVEAFALAHRQLNFAQEYLELAKKFWPREGVATVKGHLFKMLYHILEVPANYDLREKLGAKGNGIKQYEQVVQELLETRYSSIDVAIVLTKGAIVSPVSWYRRHREGHALALQREKQLCVSGNATNAGLKERLLEKRASRRIAL